MASWGERAPKVHVASARAPGAKAHAVHVANVDVDLALEMLSDVGGDRPVDVMLEAKAKEAAVLRQIERSRGRRADAM